MDINLIKKLVIGGSLIAGACTLVRVCRKEYRREQRNFELAKKEIAELGLNWEKMYNEQRGVNTDSLDDALLLKIYNALKEDWEDELIDGESVMMGGVSSDEEEMWGLRGFNNSIHVIRERFRGESRINFLIQIPPYSKERPTPGDYVTQIKERMTNLLAEGKTVGGGEPKIYKKGYVSMKATNTGLNLGDGEIGYPEIYVEIPERIYKKFESEGRQDGLARMITHYSDKKTLKDSDYESVNMFCVVSFPMENEVQDGLGMIEAIHVLKELTDNPILRGRDGGGGVDLGPIVFHANGDLGRYYANDMEVAIQTLD